VIAEVAVLEKVHSGNWLHFDFEAVKLATIFTLGTFEIPLRITIHGRPSRREEFVNSVGSVRMDFMQIAVDGNGIPTISCTTPSDFDKGVTTASRTVAP